MSTVTNESIMDDRSQSLRKSGLVGHGRTRSGYCLCGRSQSLRKSGLVGPGLVEILSELGLASRDPFVNQVWSVGGREFGSLRASVYRRNPFVNQVWSVKIKEDANAVETMDVAIPS